MQILWKETKFQNRIHIPKVGRYIQNIRMKNFTSETNPDAISCILFATIFDSPSEVEKKFTASSVFQTRCAIAHRFLFSAWGSSDHMLLNLNMSDGPTLLEGRFVITGETFLRNLDSSTATAINSHSILSRKIFHHNTEFVPLFDNSSRKSRVGLQKSHWLCITSIVIWIWCTSYQPTY